MAKTAWIQRAAEMAAERYLLDRMKCVATRRAVKAKYAKVDFFGADVVGRLESGANIYAQVTTGKGPCVSNRKGKLAAYPWYPSDTVLVLQLVTERGSRRNEPARHSFRVWEYHAETYDGVRSWKEWDQQIEVPNDWLQKPKRRLDGMRCQSSESAPKSGGSSHDG